MGRCCSKAFVLAMIQQDVEWKAGVGVQVAPAGSVSLLLEVAFPMGDLRRWLMRRGCDGVGMQELGTRDGFIVHQQNREHHRLQHLPDGGQLRHDRQGSPAGGNKVDDRGSSPNLQPQNCATEHLDQAS